MRETGIDDGRMPLRSPGTLEWRDQREAAFVLKSQSGVKPAPFFLSAANDIVSTAPRHARRAGVAAAQFFTNSSPCASTHARQHSDDSAPQTSAKLNGRCDPASSNLRRSPGSMLPLPTGALNRPAGADLTVGDAPEPARASAEPRRGPFGAITAHCARSLPMPRRLRGDSCPDAPTPTHGGAERLALRLFLLVACPLSCHLCLALDINYSETL